MKKIFLFLMSISLIQVCIIGCVPPGHNVRGNAPAKEKIAYNKKADIQTEENVFDDQDEDAVMEKVSSTAGDSEYEAEEIEDFYQKGMASWYGREFHGKSTASGQKFDMNKLTAAHKSLPFGTVVEVKNLDNGKSIQVTINDRGPYKANRIIDLSFGAAKKLDMVKQGKAPVGIIIVKKGNGEYTDEAEEDDSVEPVSDELIPEKENSIGNFSLQAGAFYSKKNADDLRKRVQDLTNHNAKLFNDGDMYKVRIEGINSRKEASRFKKILEYDDIPSFLIEK